MNLPKFKFHEKTNPESEAPDPTLVSANPDVLQELMKPEGEREHEILSRRRRDVVKPHGYPLSGFDENGRQMLVHSGERARLNARR